MGHKLTTLNIGVVVISIKHCVSDAKTVYLVAVVYSVLADAVNPVQWVNHAKQLPVNTS